MVVFYQKPELLQGLINMRLYSFLGDIKLFGNFAILQAINPAHYEYLPLPWGQFSDLLIDVLVKFSKNDGFLGNVVAMVECIQKIFLCFKVSKP